eukprot:TRINITY_DN12287_c0_g1_i1.p1 TRINITY_DN12287_c0_g1~~TRINITY_DN12287_c0_g1_i1.p1  ORF type:complete len:311 (-),score=59.76 TRINITY_DN12287_c0_g1_i1:714-1646(-)
MATDGPPPPFTVTEVQDFQDTNVTAYRGIRDNADMPASSGKFIAEGPETLRLLLASSIEIDSLLLSQNQLDNLRDAIQTCGKPIRIYIGSKKMLSDIVGFNFVRGALACGIRPPNNDITWLRDLIRSKPQFRCLICDGVNDVANIGGLIRTASALGMDAVLLSSDCCDAWYRRSIRTSMGHIFRLPIVRSDCLADDMRLMSEQEGLCSYSAVIDADAPTLSQLAHVGQKWGLIVGSEHHGISAAVRMASTSLLRIAMAPGVDSLNVGVAAGILLHNLREATGGVQEVQVGAAAIGTTAAAAHAVASAADV